MRKTVLALSLLLGSCSAVSNAAEYGHDRVAEGEMDEAEYGTFMFHTVGADHQAQDKIISAVSPIADFFGDLGLKGGVGGLIGLALVKFFRKGPLQSQSEKVREEIKAAP